MFKKIILLCLVLSLLITGTLPALAEDPVEYCTFHSVDELIEWINTAKAEDGEEFAAWYPFLRAARLQSELRVAVSASEEYTLKEILVPAAQDNMQFFYENGTHKFMVYIELPGTVDKPKASLSERVAKMNEELALAYEGVQYTALTYPGIDKPTGAYILDGGEYQKKDSEDTEVLAPTKIYCWVDYTIMIQGIGDLYGTKWDNDAYSGLFHTETVALNPEEIYKLDLTEKFTDEAFRNFVYAKIGKEPGEPIYDTDIANIREFEIHNESDKLRVYSLAGIEYFAGLERLEVANCKITELDVSMLKNLNHLAVHWCRSLTSLKANGLEKLTGLSCYDNGLTELQVSAPSLIYIHATDNQLSALDLSGCPALEELYISRNNLKTLDITPCPELRLFSCYRNDFTSPDDIIGYDKNKWVEPLYSFDFYPQKPQPYATADTNWYHEEEDAFAIGTAEELIGLAKLVNSGTDFSGKTILLENNIDLSDYAGDWNDGKGWTPIGNNDAPFKGTFNGNNKTISGLYINDSKLDYAGLFGCMDQGKVIQLGLVNVEIHAKDHVGGIAGSLGTSNWTPEDYPPANCAAVKNCFVTGVVEGKEYVGGIAGSISCSYINDCYADADATGTSGVGGIIGSAGSAGVENCYSTGSISGSKNVGGIAGSFSGGSLYTCYATGEIKGSDCVGGIVGNNIFNITRQCAALNDSVSGETNVGRIAGCSKTDSQLETNYALDSMTIFEGSTQKATLLNTHDQVDGADIGKETSMTAAFWLETMEYRANVFTIADGSYPALSKVLEIGSGFYRVYFVDWDGRELKSILVPHGSAAKAPASPVRKDYFFAGWDQALDNVTGDLTVTATYRLADPFVDVAEEDWFYDGFLYAYEKEFMKGVSDDRFAPQEDVSRAMAITVLYREMGSPAIDLLWLTAWPFQDVPMSEWYSRAALWGAKYGVVNGYDHRTFGPNDSVTREQLVTMFWRTRGCPEASADVLSGFSDAAEISSWAVDAFAWAVDRGLIQGKPGGTLDPQGTTTRAELAQILMNSKA